MKSKPPSVEHSASLGAKCRAISLLYAAGNAAPKRKHGQPLQPTPRERYLARIASPAWLAFRAEIFAERGEKCERCQPIRGVLDLHHLTYKRLGHEEREDVMILCRDCHKAVHHKKCERRKAERKRKV